MSPNGLLPERALSPFLVAAWSGLGEEALAGEASEAAAGDVHRVVGGHAEEFVRFSARNARSGSWLTSAPRSRNCAHPERCWMRRSPAFAVAPSGCVHRAHAPRRVGGFPRSFVRLVRPGRTDAPQLALVLRGRCRPSPDRVPEGASPDRDADGTVTGHVRAASDPVLVGMSRQQLSDRTYTLAADGDVQRGRRRPHTSSGSGSSPEHRPQHDQDSLLMICKPSFLRRAEERNPAVRGS
ncbi:hypothetical protein QF037_009200 [Streptomyces canus]|nr:hypothetical protein [Streptomyces canus]